MARRYEEEDGNVVVVVVKDVQDGGNWGSRTAQGEQNNKVLVLNGCIANRRAAEAKMKRNLDDKRLKTECWRSS